jgi:hypothetical protein
MQLIDCVTTFCKFHFHSADSSYPAGVLTASVSIFELIRVFLLHNQRESFTEKSETALFNFEVCVNCAEKIKILLFDY